MRDPWTVRMSPAERNLFRTAAEREGTGWTVFVRESAVEKATRVLARDGDDADGAEEDRQD